MSLAFSDTSTKKGLIQTIERSVFPGNTGKISGNTTLLAEFTAEINLALDRAFAIIFKAGGRWHFDDSNHSGNPELTANIVSGTREYSFSTDGTNLTVAIEKVLILPSATATRYVEIGAVDIYEDAPNSFFDGSGATGVPSHYGKRGVKLSLDPVPNYSATSGLKVEISREGSYFTTADTTKKPGIAPLFHEYLALRPAWVYASNNALPVANSLHERMLRMEAEMAEHYALRERDVRHVMKPRITPFI